MYSQNQLPAPDFLSSRETYEKYERTHNRNFGRVPVAVSGATPVTYLNEYQVVTQSPTPQGEVMVPMPPEQPIPTSSSIPKQYMQPLPKRRISFGRVVAGAIAIPLFIMFFLFIAIWFQELGFI
ncbi:unnamed protein product [Litomosoides sigmodontis]|uniref:Uncharacterized protein n=1 Tax=Litomosoides sigmodontis TaxID=42156 RepID=A0A3P6V6R8_LITSI|nr:unnamed protein product [Litomosoides sigmodontis]